MSWVRIEDAVTEHRKHLKAGPAACWLWVCGIAYCQRQSSDGFVPLEALPMIGVAGLTRCRKLAEILVEVGLFEHVVGGYLVHDYHDYNDTREEAQQRKADLSAKRSRAGRLGGIKSGATRSRPVEANSEATCLKQNEAERSPIPSHPIPSHPERGEEPPDNRSKRPIFRGQRLTVFEWQLDDCARLLGHDTDAFDLHAWFDALDAMAVREGLVLPKRDGGEWLQGQLVAEAQRRGFPLQMATAQQAGKLTTRMASAIANIEREMTDSHGPKRLR